MPPFPGDLFPPQNYPYYFCYLATGLFYLCYLFMLWSTLLFASCVIFTSVACLIPVLTCDFRGDRTPPKGQKVEELRHVENFTRVYRSVQLLHKLFLETYGLILVPIQSLVGQYGLICNYSLISQWDEMDNATKMFLLVQFVVIQVTWFMFLNLSGWFHDNSVKVLKSWKALGINMRTRTPMWNGKPVSLSTLRVMRFRSRMTEEQKMEQRRKDRERVARKRAALRAARALQQGDTNGNSNSSESYESLCIIKKKEDSP
ncbi:hypothetical protein Fcan01_27018 [Folsomia candida]|uniref:Uncharacterized protein n=1 Tax=Folsomia candida TaxID=158441 RepID=A0A226D0A6_FOLCA|nr:hypothetical protein Fcan01_27018 [Folsomia candida]